MAQEPDFFAQRVLKARRFWLDLRPHATPGPSVACGGWEVCGAGYRVARAGFPWPGIELVVEGRGRLTLAGRVQPLSPGSVFAYGPGIAHEIVADPARPMRKYFLDFGGRAAAPTLADAGLAPGTVAHLPLPAQARAILDLLIEAGCAGGPRAPALCGALARAALEAIGAAAVAPGRAQEPAYATYLRCRRWLDDRGDAIASLGEAATACGISAAYLCRLFRRYDRSSPWKLVRARRLQRAAELLVDPRLRVAEVAGRLGYADQFHFSRAFTRCFGVSPQRFRASRGGAVGP